MGRNRSAISSIISIILLLAAFLIILTVLPPVLSPKPPVEVTSSLNPSTINENEAAKLTLSVKNLDLKTHEIRFAFDANPRIEIYIGTEQLLHDNIYSLTLEASDPSEERVLTITGSLEEKVTSAQYVIKMRVYVDGNELAKAREDITLTIRKP